MFDDTGAYKKSMNHPMIVRSISHQFPSNFPCLSHLIITIRANKTLKTMINHIIPSTKLSEAIWNTIKSYKTHKRFNARSPWKKRKTTEPPTASRSATGRIHPRRSSTRRAVSCFKVKQQPDWGMLLMSRIYVSYYMYYVFQSYIYK